MERVEMDEDGSLARGKGGEGVAQGVMRDVMRGVGLAVVYAGLVWVGLRWAIQPGMGSAIFPAAGVALAGLLVFGVRLWPAIVVGRLVMFWLEPSGLPLWMIVLVSLGTAGTAVVGALLLTRVIKIDLSLGRLRDVMWLIGIGAAVSPLVGASVAAVAAVLNMGTAWNWRGTAVIGVTWWAGNLMGVLMVTPLVLSWMFGPALSRRWQMWAHLALALTVAAGISAYIFFTKPPSAAEAVFTSPGAVLRIWLILPAVLWASMVKGVRGATLAGFVVCVIAMVGTAMGHGPFRSFADPLMKMVTLQQYAATTMATALVMAIVTDERRGKVAISRALSRLRAAHGELEKAHGVIRESDAKFRQIAETISHIFWVSDLSGKMLYASPAFEKLFGEPVEQLYAGTRVWSKHVHPEDQEAALGLWRAWLKAVGEGSNETYVNEYRIVAGDGSVRWLSERGQVVELGPKDGVERRVAGISEDITARRLAELDRERSLEGERAARRELERASRVKDEFLATLSHELRTPLNAIMGWSQLILTCPEEIQTVREGLEVIERNAEAQARLIEDLLDMSRIAAGKMLLEFKSMDGVQLVRGTMDAVRRMAVAKGVELVDEITVKECAVQGDAGRLQQVMTNLLTNAVKFTPPAGTVRVRIECDDEWMRWVVEDTGQGIAEEFLPHVFERFRQADSSTTRRHGGLGLGLAIVRQLVELHGGEVTAESEGAGKGSRFTVSLPRVRAAEKRDGKVGGTTLLMGSRGLEGVRVLAVDDEADSLKMMERLLTNWGAKVTTASSGLAALDLLQTGKFDVLLSDVGMAEMDGYELIRRVRTSVGTGNERVRAVAVTAFVREEDKAAAREAGFDEHLGKPVDPGVLIRVVGSR